MRALVSLGLIVLLGCASPRAEEDEGVGSASAPSAPAAREEDRNDDGVARMIFDLYASASTTPAAFEPGERGRCALPRSMTFARDFLWRRDAAAGDLALALGKVLRERRQQLIVNEGPGSRPTTRHLAFVGLRDDATASDLCAKPGFRPISTDLRATVAASDAEVAEVFFVCREVPVDAPPTPEQCGFAP